MQQNLPITIRKGQALRKRLAAGEPLLGAWSTLGSTAVAVLMARAGYDFLLIDLEHGRGDVGTVADQVQALLALPTAIVVRCPDHSPATIKRVLDAGANCLLFPMVNTVAQARAIVSACRFPPKGERGVAVGAIAAADHGYLGEVYFETADDATTIIMQVETPTAIDAMAEIAALPAVDGFFIGPNDLSASMGMFRQYEHPDFVAALARIESIAKATGRVLGGLPYPQRSCQDLLTAGHQLVPVTSDQALLRQGSLTALAQITRS